MCLLVRTFYVECSHLALIARERCEPFCEQRTITCAIEEGIFPACLQRNREMETVMMLAMLDR